MLSSRLAQHFDNKVVWITGASSGIGRALAIALSEFACQIFISARSKEKLEKTREMCNQGNVIIAEGDLTDKQTNHDICQSIKKEAGHIDIAILNAGTCEYVDIDNFDSALFKRLMDTNFMSMVYGIEAALPLLRESDDAQLVGMSSTAAYLGLPRSEAYGATKAAILNLFSALRVSLHSKNVSASVICPGFVATELTARNDFPMPALISTEKAADYILEGIAKYKHEIHFPRRFSLTLKLIGSLPNSIRTWMIRKSVARS